MHGTETYIIDLFTSVHMSSLFTCYHFIKIKYKFFIAGIINVDICYINF